MNPREILKQQFLQVVDNQLREDNPPETKQTLLRLQQIGYSEGDAKLLIAQCVATELMTIMESNETFNLERYRQCLERLPESPE